jgi:hypothetical protein
MLAAFFYAKGIFQGAFVPEKQGIISKAYKEVIKRFIT